MGREEHYITCKVFHPRCPSSVSGKAYALQGVREVSAYVERLPSPGTVLLDAYQGFAIPLVSAHPTRYVVTSDRDFAYSALHPSATVRYVLVPAPTGLGRSDRINRQYPSLWHDGASWAQLVRQFGDTQDHWKLYEVVASAVPARSAPHGPWRSRYGGHRSMIVPSTHGNGRPQDAWPRSVGARIISSSDRAGVGVAPS